MEWLNLFYCFRVDSKVDEYIKKYKIEYLLKKKKIVKPFKLLSVNFKAVVNYD